MLKLMQNVLLYTSGSDLINLLVVQISSLLPEDRTKWTVSLTDSLQCIAEGQSWMEMTPRRCFTVSNSLVFNPGYLSALPVIHGTGGDSSVTSGPYPTCANVALQPALCCAQLCFISLQLSIWGEERQSIKKIIRKKNCMYLNMISAISVKSVQEENTNCIGFTIIMYLN
ncbi:hypothetical protein EK904_012665, partial [Melospiza melodia maxima]